MTLDANLDEPPESESDRVRNRYWSYYYGSIIPAWLDTMVGDEVLWVYHERIFYRRKHVAWSEGWFYFGCAIELEHRLTPARTLRQLRRLVAKVQSHSYDFNAARVLDDQVLHLQRRHTQEIERRAERWQIEQYRDLLKTDPSYRKLTQEIEDKMLPEGAAANLTLMGTILNGEKK